MQAPRYFLFGFISLSLCLLSLTATAKIIDTKSLSPMLKPIMASVVNIQVEAEVALPESLIRSLRQHQPEQMIPLLAELILLNYS